MKKHTLVYALAFTIVAGCAIPTREIKLNSSFDKELANKLLVQGNNTIKGSALMRQVGGSTVTCAGNKVVLAPVTHYGEERMQYIYGNTTGGTRFHQKNLLEGKPVFVNDDPDYLKLTKEVTCNAQGFFNFEKVADGEFFVVTEISWKANPKIDIPEGGVMFKRVRVNGGEEIDVVLAP